MNKKVIYLKKLIKKYKTITKAMIQRINFFCIIKYLFLFLVLIFLTSPFYVMIVTSLKNENDIIQNNALSLPKSGWKFENYKSVFIIENFEFITYFLNTFTMVFFSTLLGSLCCILTAFALSFFKFPLKKTILMILFIGMSITSETLILTNFRTVSNLGLVDNGNGSQIPFGVNLAMTLPYLINIVHVFLLIQAFQRVPKELYYTAKVDGTTDWKYLWKILFPITKASIIVVSIFRTIAAWNAYTWPELVGAKVLTNMIRKTFDIETSIDILNIQMAISVLINLPLLIMFIMFRKYIISGENRHGIKG
ncbi:carbohydrate ABC transporter permease [Candidatus Phytoplasma melaleucae]|uniref:Carbohydrate ABC transporter permease n=1 Tax=Candidatus Phytoplasma melaleucae TaxID=2982630 RepID=A0ABT9DDD7_9MOLU|nr:carbohydrate ABC transporter permease ['Melaleuca sp.' phytoplasma]MDO8168059.1 carbohydrate ABC transporter permease ['Melaleuca sp.' phytoplasma]MDV3205340.1 carbohydrate ABC transporter permease [Weeping tea tree witches'-broom phytoplasma]